MEQRLEAIRDMKYEVQETMINNNVEYEIVGVCVNMARQKMESCREFIDRLKGCLEDLCEKKEAEIRRKNTRYMKRGSKEDQKNSQSLKK